MISQLLIVTRKLRSDSIACLHDPEFRPPPGHGGSWPRTAAGDDDDEEAAQPQPQLALSAAAAAGLLLVLSGLTASASVAGLAAAAPLLLLFSPVLVPAAVLACLLATGAMASGALALGALSILSRLLALVRSSCKAPDEDDQHDRVEQGKRRVGELAAVAGETTPHAVLAVVGRDQAATEHREAKNYEHYVAGRMVQSA